MKGPAGRARTPGKAKPKTRTTSRTSSPRKPSTTAKSATKASVKAKRAAIEPTPDNSASRLIDQRIRDLDGWRGETLARMRALILEADPAMTEEWKWDNPVWSHHGIVCTGEAYKKVVKLTFPRGASISDPSRLFNSSLAGNTRRGNRHRRRDPGRWWRLQGAREGRGGPKWRGEQTVEPDDIPMPAKRKPRAKGTTRASKPRESAARSGSSTKAKPGARKAGPSKVRKGKVALLSGGNPQIAKGEGDAPVQAYIAAMPGWKRDVGQRLDALIVRNVPDVRKAVKWNSPFYGVEGQGWFLSFHVFTRYVKVAFFRGASLRPVPPGASKHNDVRYFDIHEGEELDESPMATWVKQAAALRGWDSGGPS